MDCIWLQNGLFQQRWQISESRMAVDVVLLIVVNCFICLFDFLFTFSQNEGVCVS